MTDDGEGAHNLPELPAVEIAVVRERSADRAGFLHLLRYDLEVSGEGRRESASFAYDMVDRRALDACVVVAHHLDAAGVRHVWLVSSVRPPLALRSVEARGPGLWEVCAGLIEPMESERAAAARELEEELGFRADPHLFVRLGGPSAPAPAFIGEIHHYFHVEVDPAARRPPAGDGSPLEAASRAIAVPLERALAACRAGELLDAKTELAVRRLKDALDAEEAR